jgi:hypothetical protein
MTQYRLSVFPRDALEGLKEIIERQPVSEVIEQCFHWQSRTAKNGSAS